MVCLGGTDEDAIVIVYRIFVLSSTARTLSRRKSQEYEKSFGLPLLGYF